MDGWDSDVEEDPDADLQADVVGAALHANHGPTKDDRWFSLKPRSYPKRLTVPRHRGDGSKFFFARSTPRHPGAWLPRRRF